MTSRTERFLLKLKNLPDSSGVYLFRDNRGNIIYIGKAKKLKNRVRSYFSAQAQLNPKTHRMISKAADVDLMVTDSEVEALILEANLIREHKPRYNVMLKDDKHFPYIKITTNEVFPRVLVVRKIKKDGAAYFGPYTSSKYMRRTVTFLSQLFKIRTCNFVIPHPKGRKYKVCLDYRINRCGGPCAGLQTKEEYGELVNGVMMVLSGKSKELVEQLTDKMKEASKGTDFEQAATLRDQIQAIQSVMTRQKVDVGEIVDRDIISVAREEKDAVAVVMQIREGALIGRQEFQLVVDIDEPAEILVETFLSQYYNHQPNLPGEVHLPLEIPNLKLISTWLKRMRGGRVKLFTPQKGKKVRLVDLAARNARLILDEILIQKRQATERTSKMVTALKDDLGLNKSPRALVCFDISNTGETDAVGSCVLFENGKPKKSGYRRFKIRGVTGQDDFKMMREIIGRYFFKVRESIMEKSLDDTKRIDQPDLVIVDGGKGQLSSAKAELDFLGFKDQPIIGLAKKLEEVYFPGRSDPTVIAKSSPGLMLLKRARDESHRFAIEYNRKVRSKRTVKSELDNISGIGPAKRMGLLKKFGSVAEIEKASAEQLAEVKGITAKLAAEILKELNNQ
ncbi:MAG: excinuclease ABC subunit UvrC [bacterium]|nr:excinuclease ABC subunit UvrC [bacterium]